MTDVKPPKNDKARKAWLASLKDGDEVVWQTQAGTVLVGTVSTFRDRFSVCDRAFTSKTGTAAAGWNRQSGHYLADGWLVPVTDELRSQAYFVNQSDGFVTLTPGFVPRAHEVAVACARDQLKRLNWTDWQHKFTSEQILAVAAILWPKDAA